MRFLINVRLPRPPSRYNRPWRPLDWRNSIEVNTRLASIKLIEWTQLAVDVSREAIERNSRNNFQARMGLNVLTLDEIQWKKYHASSFFIIAKKVSYQARMGLNVLTLDEVQ
jgi:hypothetical protein